MTLYSQNLRQPSRSRIPLSKQLDDTEPGYYGVNRIFLPGKYPSATLCTPYFRVSIPQKDWETVKQEISASSALVVYFDGDNWELLTDKYDLFAIRYEGDDYGAHYNYDDPESLFLTPNEWNEGINAMKKANEQSQQAESKQNELPF